MDDDKGLVISIGRGENKTVIHNSATAVKINGADLRKSSSGVDLVFVMDTTGSMSSKIESLLATCEQFVDEFAQMKLDHRIAVIAFGDLRVRGDRIERTAFTANIETTRQSLRHIPRFSGGGNEGESPLEAIQAAREMSYRPKAVKVIILITDEPAHQDKYTARDMTANLMEDEFLVFTVSPDIDYYKKMAGKNGGKWYRISAHTDFTDLLDMFKDLANKVSNTVSNVYKLSDGSVSQYLQLNSPDN